MFMLVYLFCFFFSSRRRHTRCALVTGVQTCALPISTSPRPLAFVELPYTFRSRTQGESKLDHVVAMEYLIALYDRMFGRLIPVRFAMFSAIGLLGVGVHMAVLSVLLFAFDTAFVVGQIVAATVAMTANFFLNNAQIGRAHV